VWSQFATALAALGVILAAAYILWLMQRVVFGTPAPAHRAHLLDLNARETATLVPLIVLVFVLGIFPNPLLTRMHASVTNLLNAQKAPAFAVAPQQAALTKPAGTIATVVSPSSSEQAAAR
jgi:NADH-quinone oxidoreductase subunit M